MKCRKYRKNFTNVSLKHILETENMNNSGLRINVQGVKVLYSIVKTNIIR